MKLEPRTLAMRTEQMLEAHIPSEIIKVTHSPFKGVKIQAIIGSERREYIGGLSWTTCEMVCNKLIKDYVAAKYGRTHG